MPQQGRLHGNTFSPDIFLHYLAVFTMVLFIGIVLTVGYSGYIGGENQGSFQGIQTQDNVGVDISDTAIPLITMGKDFTKPDYTFVMGVSESRKL